jgi:hypothetical protein
LTIKFIYILQTKYGGFGTPLWQIENVYVDNIVAENMETVRLMLILVGRERLRIASDEARKHLNDNKSSMSIYGKIFNLFYD